MNATLCDAIRDRKIVKFHYDYDRGMRTVEPFCYGVSTSGNDVLRGYQTGAELTRPVPWLRVFVEGVVIVNIVLEQAGV